MAPILKVASFIFASALADDLPVSPKQAAYLTEMQQKAVAASESAEEELLKLFKEPQFRAGLLEHGALGLAMTPADKLLDRVKTALSSMEYTSNFGVSEAYRKTNPGQPSMNFSTIDDFGYIPGMWELRALNSSLVAGTPLNQWKIMEAAETGLYQYPISESSKLPAGPTQEQAAAERPQYLAGNIHSRADVGVPRYGVYGAVMRNDVVRERALMLSTDSGGWQNDCNKTVTPIQKWFEILGPVLTRCHGAFAGGKDRPVLGTLDHQLHTILGNTVTFGKMGGHLSRLIWELLDGEAKVRRLETLFYTEAGLMGPLRPQDMKLLVASFPTVYGTPEADVVRAFCARHKVPLAWALSSGETWDGAQVQKATLPEWIPFSKLNDPVGGARVLDPSSWQFTNVAQPKVESAIWEEIELNVKSLRNKTGTLGDVITADQYQGWLSTLGRAGGGLETLRGGECESADLCFGTFVASHVGPVAKRECICRAPVSEDIIV